MNILFSSTSYVFSDHIPGGEYQVAHAIVSGLAARGHNIHIIVPKAKLREPIPNVTIHEISGYDFVERESYFAYRWNWWTFTIRSYRLAKKLTREYPIDIVHHIRPAFLEKFSLCWRLPLPFVYGPVSLPMTHSLPPNTAMPGETGKTGIIGKLKNKLIDKLNFTVGKWLWDRMMETAASVPVSVQPTRNYLPDCCQNKSPIIPLGVDPNEFSPAPSETTSQAPEIFYAGHLVAAKGVDYLIQAMQKVHEHIPNARLVLAGDGFERPRLKTMAQNLGIEDYVEFLGPVPFTQMPDLFRRCAIFCLPTLAEAFGLSLLQAMASGKPIVASAVGGIPYFVEDGKSGHLVPSCNVDALSDALIDLLQHPEKMVSMGKHNRTLIEQHYSWNPIVTQIETLYTEVLNRAH